jgi:hypothetical protein
MVSFIADGLAEKMGDVELHGFLGDIGERSAENDAAFSLKTVRPEFIIPLQRLSSRAPGGLPRC